MVEVNSFQFGSIVIDGKAYSSDVIVTYKGKVKEAKTKLRHLLKDELFELLFERPEIVLIGTGEDGLMKVSEDAKAFAVERKIEVLALPTLEAVAKFNELVKAGKAVVAYFHVTC